MTITITLPCTANELERVLHNLCDNHGCWDTASVTANNDQLVINSNERINTND